MKLRTTWLAVPVACLMVVGGWQLTRNIDAIRVAPVVRSNQATPLETQPSNGASGSVAERIAAPVTLAEMHVATPAEVREVLSITREATADDCFVLTQAALHAEDALVAGNAVVALGRLGEFSSDAALLVLVSDARLRVRQDAVKACGLDGRAEALPYLECALGEEGAQVRPLIMEALGKIGGSTARELLQRVLDDPSASKIDRVFARAALERMQA